MTFYKSSNDIVPTAWNEYKKDADIFLKKYKQFAANFDAKPLIGFSVTGHRFHGIILDNYEDREDKALWTLPRKNTRMVSKVRSSIKDKSLKEELSNLKEKYKNLKPAQFEVSTDELLTSMGTDWGNLVFIGISWQMVNNILYVETSIKLNENMQEILGSEYREAIANKDVSHA